MLEASLKLFLLIAANCSLFFVFLIHASAFQTREPIKEICSRVTVPLCAAVMKTKYVSTRDKTRK